MKKSIVLRGKWGLWFLFLLMILTNTAGCSKDNMEEDMHDTPVKPDAPKPGTNEVWMQGSLFNPDKITVTAGTTITWTNKDGSVHTVTSDTGLFDSGNMASNATFTHKFSTTGTFTYHCTLHKNMTGTITVN